MSSPTRQHVGLVHEILLFSAWGQAGGAVIMPLAVLAALGWSILRWRRKKTAGQAQADPEHMDQPQAHDDV